MCSRPTWCSKLAAPPVMAAPFLPGLPAPWSRWNPIPISPPDDEGWCSFGGGVWFGPSVAGHARTLIGEVHPTFIRTGGQNRIHVSRFARLAEITGTPPAPPIPPRSE